MNIMVIFMKNVLRNFIFVKSNKLSVKQICAVYTFHPKKIL